MQFQPWQCEPGEGNRIDIFLEPYTRKALVFSGLSQKEYDRLVSVVSASSPISVSLAHVRCPLTHGNMPTFRPKSDC